METTRKTTTYTAEFRASAVKLALESDLPTAQIARELGITKSTLYTWIYNHRNGNKKPAAKNDDNLLEELKNLRKENKRLKEEREILKKAAAYFAKEVK